MTSESQIADSPTIPHNDSPSYACDTVVQTQKTLALVQQDIVRLQSDTYLPSDLTRLLTQEQQLLRDLGKQRRIVESCSYIDKLFDEILAQVFLLLVHKYYIDWKVGRSADEAVFYPWRTAAVCKRWRAVCMDTPRLWTYIYLGYSAHSCDDSVETDRFYESRISMQLQLSKAAPLFIKFSIYCECPTVTSITQAVLAHAHRWKEADFSDTFLSSMKEFLRSIIPPGTKFKVLEDLGWTALDSGHLDIPLTDYGPLESLRRVKLIDPVLELPLEVKIPWGNLISLEIEYDSEYILELLSVLSHCQALQSINVTLTRYIPGDIVIMEEDHVFLPNIIEASFRSASDLIPCIRCPSLRKLTTSLGMYYSSKAELLDFITRSQCHKLLVDLTIHAEDPVQIIPLLQACSAIEHLSVLSSVGSLSATAQNNFISSLVLRRETTEPCLCPRLKSLSLMNMRPDMDLVKWMIDSRLNVAQPATSLEYVRWACYKDRNDESAVTIRRDILEQSYSSRDITFDFEFKY